MAIQLAAAALPIIGATLGGIQGYQQSGGDIGTAALSSGLGALSLGALSGPMRMAGSALMDSRFGPAIQQALTKAGPAVYQASSPFRRASALNPETRARLGAGMAKDLLGKGALLAGTLAIPAVTGGIANVLSGPARAATGGLAQVGQTGLGAVTSNQRYASKYGADLPSGVPLMMDQYGNIAPIGSPSDVLGPQGMGRTLESQREGKAIAENLQRFGDIDLKYKEAAAKKDFERQAAMKAIATNIGTNAAMLQNAQIGAQNLGQTFGTGIANTIGQIYQYS